MPRFKVISTMGKTTIALLMCACLHQMKKHLPRASMVLVLFLTGDFYGTFERTHDEYNVCAVLNSTFASKGAKNRWCTKRERWNEMEGAFRKIIRDPI